MAHPNNGVGQGSDEGHASAPPPLKLPPLRTYVVRKNKGLTAEGKDIVEETTVVAHMMQVADRYTVKFIDIEDYMGEPMPIAHRVFFDVDDVQEVMRKMPAGLITH